VLTQHSAGRSLVKVEPAQHADSRPERDPRRYTPVAEMPSFAPGFRPGFRIVRLD